MALLKIVRGYKTELDLNNVQRNLCLRAAGTARFAYNWGLAQKKVALKNRTKLPSAMELHKQLNTLKQTDFPWMYEVSKCAAQEALRDLDTAFERYFQKIAGFPKPKKRSRAIGSFTLTGAIHVTARSVQLPRLGVLRLKEKGYLPTNAKILSATVSEQAGHWFVSVQVEEFVPEPTPATGAPVGVDLGLKVMAIDSNGQTYANPKPLKAALKKLKRLQRQLARCVKGSNHRKKVKAKLARLHYRIACLRIDATHKTTSAIVAKTKPSQERPQIVVIEDLNVKGMLKNHKLAFAIADVGFGRFKQFMTYKTAWAGSTLLKADRFYPSTQTCSACGRRRTIDLTLADRLFVCEFADCQLQLDRDWNAAINLRNLAFKTTASLAESNACRETVRPDAPPGTEGYLAETRTKHQKRHKPYLAKI